MNLSKIKYIILNWKLVIHLVLRTKRFGVNNNWWNDYDSIFGQRLYRILISLLLIYPIINNYKYLKFRLIVCHFISDEEKIKLGFKN